MMKYVKMQMYSNVLKLYKTVDFYFGSLYTVFKKSITPTHIDKFACSVAPITNNGANKNVHFGQLPH